MENIKWLEEWLNYGKFNKTTTDLPKNLKNFIKTSNIPLYRGFSLNEPISNTITIDSYSSWTSYYDIAYEFASASDENYKYIVKLNTPIEVISLEDIYKDLYNLDLEKYKPLITSEKEFININNTKISLKEIKTEKTLTSIIHLLEGN